MPGEYFIEWKPTTQSIEEHNMLLDHVLKEYGYSTNNPRLSSTNVSTEFFKCFDLSWKRWFIFVTGIQRIHAKHGNMGKKVNRLSYINASDL